MNFTLVYLGRRFLYRIVEFLRHWYVKSLFIYFHQVINFLEQLDKYFAWRVTLKHLFQPLYKDFSIIGYVLGFIFRFSRLMISSFVYFFLILIAVLGYIVWLFIPLYIILKILND